MQIIIDANHKITSDSRQYLLQEIKTVLNGDKKGEVYESTLGYYSTISNTLKAYRELQIRSSNVTTIDELLEFIKQLDSKLDKLEIIKGEKQ